MEVVLLPVLDLRHHVLEEAVANVIVEDAPLLGLIADALPGGGRRPVLDALLDDVEPLLGPAAEAFRVRLLNVGALLDEHDQVIAQLGAILGALRGLLVVSWLPKTV